MKAEELHVYELLNRKNKFSFGIVRYRVLMAVLRIRDVISDPDPGSNKSNKRGGGENLFSSFFEATNFTDLKIILFFNRYRYLQKKIFANWKRILVFLPRKLSKIWVGDPGVKKAPDPDPGSATLFNGKQFLKGTKRGEGGTSPVSVNITLVSPCPWVSWRGSHTWLL